MHIHTYAQARIYGEPRLASDSHFSLQALQLHVGTFHSIDVNLDLLRMPHFLIDWEILITGDVGFQDDQYHNNIRAYMHACIHCLSQELCSLVSVDLVQLLLRVSSTSICMECLLKVTCTTCMPG